MKVTVVCSDGLGTSLMMEMSVKGVLKDLFIDVDVDYINLDPARGTPSDIYVGAKGTTEQLIAQSVTGKIVALKNTIDKKAMRERLSVVLAGLDALQAGGDIDFFHLLMNNVLSELAILVGLIALIGLITQKKSATECVRGTVKTIMGFMILGTGADLVVSSLGDFADIFRYAFSTQGVVPNNETIVSIAQRNFRKEMTMIMFFAVVINTVITRFTPWKFIFLTDHHTLFTPMMVAVILATAGMTGVMLITIGSLVVGVAMVFFSVIVHPYMEKVTGSDNAATGRFPILSYTLADFISSKFGNRERSTEDMDVSKSLLSLRDTPVAISFTMNIIFLVTCLFVGADTVEELSGGKNWFMFSIMQSTTSVAGMYIILQGVRIVIAEIVPAFESISGKLILNARPTPDYPVVLSYTPSAALVGFLSNSTAGLIGIFTLYLLNVIAIIPDVMPHFFVGTAAGVLGDTTGRRRGAILGTFAQGLLVTFLPVFLLPVLSDTGFVNTIFSDVDFGTPGILLRTIVCQYFDDINILQGFRNMEGINFSCFLRFFFFQSGLCPISRKRPERCMA